MKKKKFYRFVLKDNKKIGVLYAPKEVDTQFGVEVLPVQNYEDIIFTLKGGIYVPFMNSDVCANFANEELKLLIEEIIPENYPIEFLPVKTVSENYGHNLYYIIHFTKIFDVIDIQNSVKIPGINSIVKPWIDYEKAKNLDFFNSIARINGIIVSDNMKRMMKKRNLDLGIEFCPVPYI